MEHRWGGLGVGDPIHSIGLDLFFILKIKNLLNFKN